MIPDDRVQVIRVDPGDAPTVVYVPGTGGGDGGPPSGSAGGVLSGQYPNPGFATNMATQAELESTVDSRVAAHRFDDLPHPVYDDIPSLSLLFASRLV